MSALHRLTVVVPVAPGDRVSPRLAEQLEALAARAEVIVVHADDDASLVAQSASACWRISAPRGRSTQQNAGAGVARGEWLWFLHADSLLATDTLHALARFLAADADALGYFDLEFLDDGPALMRVNAAAAWLRSHWLGLPFGDQGLVLRRDSFQRLGGFDTALDCGEDHALVWRARHAGVPVLPVGAPLYTSARKYAARGWWPTTAWHLWETFRQARRFSRDTEARDGASGDVGSCDIDPGDIDPRDDAVTGGGSRRNDAP